MLLRTFLLSFFLVYASIGSFAQGNELPGTAVYVEIGGKGFISGNVDLPIGSKDRLILALTMLDHEFAKKEGEENFPTSSLPTPGLMYVHLFGQERHYFETGLGLSISPVPWKEYSPNDSPISLHACLGYRLQESDHFFFRAGLTPFYRINWMFLPLVGISFGYSW